MSRALALTVAIISIAPFLGSSAQATVWHIQPDSSGDAPTIAAAIELALDGDEILVGPGTYHSTQLRFQGKALWVHSSAGAEETTLRPAGIHDSFLLVQAGIDQRTTIEGFTVYGVGGASVGGGLRIDGASPIIRSSPII